jgi:3-isopropylmalate/(R)-2-methylmalate dehydratase small subunit
MIARVEGVEGKAIVFRGNDIDTDRIIPARYLKAISFEGLERYLFEDDRAQAKTKSGKVHPFNDPCYFDSTVLFVGRNFGCGSSREHAPQAIYRWGIRAIVGESFSDIFFGNAAIIGLPCVTCVASDLEKLMGLVEQDPEAMIQIDLKEMRCIASIGNFSIEIPENIRESFLTGAWDTMGMLRSEFDEVRSLASNLPYINEFKDQ